MHYIFRQPEGEPLGNGRGGLPKKKDVAIDVRGQGGYIIAPGATMGDGRTYVLNGDLADIAPPPECVVDLLQAKPAPEPVSPPAGLPVVSLPATPGRIGAYSHAGFEAEVNEVRTAPKGARSDTLNTSAFKIGTMCGAGWVTEAEAISALTVAVAGWENQRKTIDTLRRAVRDGMSHPRSGLPDELGVDPAAMVAPLLKRYDSEQAAEAPPLEQMADGSLVDTVTGEVFGGDQDDEAGDGLELYPGMRAKMRALAISDGLPRGWEDGTLIPPGLVGEITNWILDTARRPIPELALGTALVVVGTAIGRHFAGPTLSGTHLYALGLAPTGSGKEHHLASAQRLLAAAGMQHHIGASEFMSQSAVVSAVRRQPLMLLPADEWGATLKRINARNAQSHEVGISRWLRTLWGASFSPVPTPEWRNEPAGTINWPAMSVLGMSVAEELFGALGDDFVTNGFLNRHVLFASTERPTEREPIASAVDVPLTISDRLRELYRTDLAGTMLEPVHDSMTENVAGMHRLEWGAGAHGHYQRLGKRVERHSDSHPDEAPFFGRTVEIALRLATVVAAGRGSATVDAIDMVFGALVALRSANRMIWLYRGREGTSLHARQMAIVEGLIRKKRHLTKSMLTNAVARKMDAKQLAGVLAMLSEGGRIEQVSVTPPGGRGRPGVAYRWLG